MDGVQLLQAVVVGGIAAAACALGWTSLRNWRGDRYLCDDCRFNEPSLCLKRERGVALFCTVYEKGVVQSSSPAPDEPGL